MLEISNAHFERAGLRPKVKGGTYAERIAATLDLPVARVAQIMASGGKDSSGFNLAVFDDMRGDHLEMLRLLYHGDSLTDVALKIRRELNPLATVNGVRHVAVKYLAAFKVAVQAGRLSAELSASSLQPVSHPRAKFGQPAAASTPSSEARSKPAEKKPCEISPARVQPVSAGHSRPVSQPQPAITGQPAELPATHAPWWAVRPNFSQPSAGQVSGRLVDYDRLTGRSAGGGQ